MSYMDQKRGMLKEQSGDEKKTRVIDGRLYMDYADNNVYKPVPRGMDDARDLKTNRVCDYFVQDEAEYEIVTADEIRKELENPTVSFIARQGDSDPLTFLQLNYDSAIMQRDETGKLTPVVAEALSYVAADKNGDCINVSPGDFIDKYELLRTETSYAREKQEREIPEVNTTESENEMEAGL